LRGGMSRAAQNLNHFLNSTSKDCWQSDSYDQDTAADEIKVRQAASPSLTLRNNQTLQKPLRLISSDFFQFCGYRRRGIFLQGCC